jgi:hypothetical protein
MFHLKIISDNFHFCGFFQTVSMFHKYSLNVLCVLLSKGKIGYTYVCMYLGYMCMYIFTYIHIYPEACILLRTVNHVYDMHLDEE